MEGSTVLMVLTLRTDCKSAQISRLHDAVRLYVRYCYKREGRLLVVIPRSMGGSRKETAERKTKDMNDMRIWRKEPEERG